MITGALPYKCDVDLLIGIFELNPITEDQSQHAPGLIQPVRKTIFQHSMATFFFSFAYIYSFLYG